MKPRNAAAVKPRTRSSNEPGVSRLRWSPAPASAGSRPLVRLPNIFRTFEFVPGPPCTSFHATTFLVLICISAPLSPIPLSIRLTLPLIRSNPQSTPRAPRFAYALHPRQFRHSVCLYSRTPSPLPLPLALPCTSESWLFCFSRSESPPAFSLFAPRLGLSHPVSPSAS